jgi:uncharacterized membrane protein
LSANCDGAFHGAGIVHGVHYGVLVETMMFVVVMIIIVVVATMRLWERSLATTTKTKQNNNIIRLQKVRIMVITMRNKFYVFP